MNPDTDTNRSLDWPGKNNLSTPITRTNHLLVIGIDVYAHPHFSPLNNAERDAKAFIEVLKQKYDFSEQRITALFNKEATDRNIRSALRKLARDLNREDNLIVYYAGHGELEKDSDWGYWVPYEAEPNEDYFGYIRNKDIIDLLERINCYHLVLISDSCFSGAFFNSNARSGLTTFSIDPSRWALTSGRKDEKVHDGPPEEGSYFNQYLIKYLRETDGQMLFSELANKVKVATSAHTRQYQKPRGEPLQINGHEGGEFVFVPRLNLLQELTRLIEAGNPEDLEQFVESHTAELRNHKKLSFATEQVEKLYWEHIEKIATLEKKHAEVEVPSKSPATTIDVKGKKIPLPEMVLIEGGTFKRGKYNVNVSDFWLGKTAVANTAYAAFLNAKGNQSEGGKEWYDASGSGYKGYAEAAIQKQGDVWVVKAGREDHPVNYVSWYGAKAYFDWLSEQTGQKWRLPTEAEWEYAAGGSKERTIYAGTNNESELGDYAWYTKNTNDTGTRPVGQKKPNRLGIYDMTGNVWEWCNDWIDDYPSSDISDPQGPEKGTYRVSRGGSWHNRAESCRVSDRYSNTPDFRFLNLGFRPVRTP